MYVANVRSFKPVCLCQPVHRMETFSRDTVSRYEFEDLHLVFGLEVSSLKTRLHIQCKQDFTCQVLLIKISFVKPFVQQWRSKVDRSSFPQKRKYVFSHCSLLTWWELVQAGKFIINHPFHEDSPHLHLLISSIHVLPNVLLSTTSY